MRFQVLFFLCLVRQMGIDGLVAGGLIDWPLNYPIKMATFCGRPPQKSIMPDAQKGCPARPQHLRKVEVEVKVERLDGFLDFAATQAASADPDALCLTVD